MGKVLLMATRDLVVYPIRLGVIITNRKGGAVGKAILNPSEYDKGENIFASTARGYVQVSNNIFDSPLKCIFVSLNPFDKELVEDPTHPAILAHEAVHVKTFIYDALGISNDLDNDEPEAYLVGSVTRLLMEMIQELKEHEDYKKEISS